MAIALDSTASGRTSGANLSYTHTVGASLSNSIAIVGISIQDSNHGSMKVNNVTFGGKPMTLARRDEATGNNCTFIYYLLNPPSGAQTVAIQASSNTAIGELAAGSVVLSGVDQYFPIDAVNGATGNSNSPSVSLTTVANNAWSFTVISSETATTAVNNSQTAAWSNLTDQSFENCRGAYRGPISPAGATTLGYSLGSAQSWALSAISVQPSTGTVPTIALDSVSNADGATVSSLTFSHTINSNTNGILVVGAGARGTTVGNLTITGITYNGVALTKLRSDLFNTSTYVRSELWYLKAPATGTYNIVITYTGSCDIVAGTGMAFTGVDQTALLEANAGTGTVTANASSESVSITTANANEVLVFFSWIKDGAYITSQNADQYVEGQKWFSSPDDLYDAGLRFVTTATSYSVGYTTKNADGYGISVGALKPASGGGATTAVKMQVVRGWSWAV